MQKEKTPKPQREKHIHTLELTAISPPHNDGKKDYFYRCIYSLCDFKTYYCASIANKISHNNKASLGSAWFNGE